MTEDELFAIVDKTMLSERRKIELKAAVRVYSKALVAAKPIVMRSLALTEGAMKTNVKKTVMGLMSAPPPPPQRCKDVSGSLPSVDESGAAAVAISENIQPSLNAKEQAMFIAGFQECVKWLGFSRQ